jgi:hypothetical protein
VLEIANGQALIDEVSGLGENANHLQYHYICGFGSSGDGWLFADGDNYAQGNVLQRYSYATLAAAKPCAALAIRITGGGPMAGVPAGWTDDGITLTAPNGTKVVQGFRTHVLQGWEPDNYPLAAQYHASPLEPGNSSIGDGDRQDFRYRSLGYTARMGVYRIWTGQDLASLKSDLDVANATTAKLQTVLDSATATIVQLQAQLAAVPPPAPPAPPADPRADKALATLESLKELLAEL